MLRDEIIQHLQSELVGPRPGLPFVQLNGEEVLAPEDAPRIRYGAGILFPNRTDIGVQEDADSASESGGPKDEEDVFKVVESELSGVADPLADVRGDGQAETDSELSRANEFLPCAMGITALVRVKGDLLVEIDCAQYEPVALPGTTRTGKDGKQISPKHWFRRPISERKVIRLDELIDSSSCIARKLITGYNDGCALELHVFSRDTGGRIVDAQPNDRFITFSLINRSKATEGQSDTHCFFQCSLNISAVNGESDFKEYPERVADENVSGEERGLELLYRHRKVFAVGHGCSPDWLEVAGGAERIWTTSLPTYEVKPILPASLDDVDLRMATLAEAEDGGIETLQELSNRYAAWIDGAERQLDTTVPNHLLAQALKNLEACRNCCSRIKSGINLIQNDITALRAFKLMNQAMLMQHLHYELATTHKRSWVANKRSIELERPYLPPDYASSSRAWRPFQIAFVLMTIRSIALKDEQDLDERNTVDLIWFPTGGGKTEAYLGLTAFTIFYRRIKNPVNAGTTTLMRYTLRLLTTQQFQRAASLICAAETLRRKGSPELGVAAISIGLWVGGGVTPNTEDAANKALAKLLRGDRENPFIILSCPWCGAQMGPVKVGKATHAKGYKKLAGPLRVRLMCEDPGCDFSVGEGLPLHIVDEGIYSERPTLLIGTVDKFALLPWYPQAKRLFGIGSDNCDPPDLIIQDELHLISGPLGSMVGHYETVIDALTDRYEGTKRIRAKIVASTATISRASDQIRALYGGRDAVLFPPQALQAGESFFASERQDLPGRTYVGVFATGLPSLTTTEVRVLASLLQAPQCCGHKAKTELDPYWTLMVYFNSIRELGHAATLVRADISEYMSVCWNRLGLAKQWGEERNALRRYINSDMELTSRIQNSEITEYMEQLFSPYDGSRGNDAVDICLATNMIQVGLDVPRLSLMAVVGQPKSTSEYIQASSRVGRSATGPGLVVTLLSPAKPRDRSHAEHFRAFHQSIYRYVEPTSVTPFALPVTERALHALIISLYRFWGPDSDVRWPSTIDVHLEDRIRDEILGRVRTVEPDEVSRVSGVMDRIFSEWHRLPPDVWGGFTPPTDQVPFMYPTGFHAHEFWDQRAYATPSSMRNVDASCNANVISMYPD